MSGKFVYDYYDIDVPGDCADSMEALADCAINEAREGSRIYAMPAAWTAQHVSGELGDFNVRFRICRKRNRPRAKARDAAQ